VQVLTWAFFLCGPSLRVRLRRVVHLRSDPRADDTLTHTNIHTAIDTPADPRTDDTLAHACALAIAPAHHRRAGRCSVGCVLPWVPL
jgi:hypothetical protein